MTTFGFSEAQEMMRVAVRGFATKELRSGIKERDKAGVVPRDLVKKLAAKGYLGLGLPEKYGGQPIDRVSLGILVEELSRVDMVTALTAVILLNSAWNINEGSHEVSEEWLPALIKGDRVVADCVTEPDCGSDAAAMKTRAVKDGEYYELNGEKTSVSLAMDADAALVLAKTQPDLRAKGIACFLVPSLGLPGITRSRYGDLGLRALSRGSLTFDGVRIPAKNLVVPQGKAFSKAFANFDIVRVLLGLAAVSAAQETLEDTITYAKQRTAFGKPIAKFEGVSFQLAEHATIIQAARLLSYHALWLADQGLTHTKESAMCKWFCPKIAVEAIRDCLLIHGHVGYSDEYGIEQRLRDTIGLQIADGTPHIQKMIISREIIGREFLPY